jgi:predicted RNA-binding protein with RPS1 domain
MKRRIFQLFTGGLLVLLAICSCDLRSDEDKFQSEIRFFILEHLDNPSEYNPLSFQRIDNAFLSSDQELATSIMAVQDTVRTKLSLASNLLAEDTNDIMHRFLSASDNFEFNLLDELIFENLSLDKQMEKSLNKSSDSILEDYKIQQQLFNDQILQLNQQLNTLNLSVFHMDLSGKASVHYFHQYELGTAQMATVFELSTENLEVLSFKDIL